MTIATKRGDFISLPFDCVGSQFSEKDYIAVLPRLVKVLRKSFPGRKTFQILVDNGKPFHTPGANVATAAHGLTWWRLPNKSPDLNPNDYSFHSELSKSLAEWMSAVGSFKKGDFLKKVEQICSEMPAGDVKKGLRSLRGRLAQVREKKGWYIDG